MPWITAWTLPVGSCRSENSLSTKAIILKVMNTTQPSIHRSEESQTMALLSCSNGQSWYKPSEFSDVQCEVTSANKATYRLVRLLWSWKPEGLVLGDRSHRSLNRSGRSDSPYAPSRSSGCSQLTPDRSGCTGTQCPWPKRAALVENKKP